MSKRRSALVLLAALSVGLLLAGPRELKPGWNLFSKDQDVKLGAEAAAEVERQMPMVTNAELQSYVDRIGRKLAAQPEADKYPYSFKVVQDASINAFALPGGPTFVHTGLIKAAETEGQLAGVMAHEISHVALRHGTNQASKANLIQLPAMLAGALMGNDGSMLGQLAQLGIGLGANSVLLKFSRSAERDADLLGTRIMSKAGYNPIDMARFFEKLEAANGKGGIQFFNSHPNPGNRVKAVEAEIQTLPRGTYNADSGQFRAMQGIVGQLPAPAKIQPNQQVNPAGTQPAGAFREYRGRAFVVSYPPDWQAFGDQGSNTVTLAPPEGVQRLRGGGVAIGYGAMISYYFPSEGRVDLKRDTELLVRQLLAADRSMRREKRDPRRLAAGGDDALATSLVSTAPNGESESDLLVTVARPDGLFYIVLIAPTNAVTRVQPIFDQMLRSLRFAD